jgi:hypothetical protein
MYISSLCINYSTITVNFAQQYTNEEAIYMGGCFARVWTAAVVTSRIRRWQQLRPVRRARALVGIAVWTFVKGQVLKVHI